MKYKFNKPRCCCVQCGTEVSINNLPTHYGSIACAKALTKRTESEFEPDLICKFCEKECKNHNSWRNHERTCSQNTNRNYQNGMTGKEPWNKGKTADTDIRLRLQGEQISEVMKRKYAEGYRTRSQTQEYWTPERRKEKSLWKKNLHKKNPELHPNRLLAGNKNKMTYPESVAYDTLVELGIEFEHQKKIENYYVDFCIGNTIIEIDGERWHPIGNSYDESRDSQLNSLGYLVHRIRSKEPISDRIKALFNRKFN